MQLRQRLTGGQKYISAMSFVGATSFVLRCLSAASKFFFIIYFSSVSSDGDLGKFAMFATIVAVFTQVAGLEVNQVVGRKIHYLPVNEVKRLLRLHAQISITVYLILLPLIIYVYLDLLQWYWLVGAFILISEHYATELFRLNVIRLRPTVASMIIFTKNAGWVLGFVFLHHLDFIDSTINSVLNCWAFSLLAILLSSGSVKSGSLIFSEYIRLKFWMREAAKIIWQARFFIGSALAVAGIGSADKIIIAESISIESLGAYFFYQTLAAIPAMLVNFSLGATIWPRCIHLSAIGQVAAFDAAWRRMRVLYALIIAASSFIMMAAAPWVLALVGKESLAKSFEILYILLASSAMYTLCEPYKLKMYAEKSDGALFLGNASQFFVNILFGLVSSLFGGVIALSLSLFFANLISVILYHYRVPELTIKWCKR